MKNKIIKFLALIIICITAFAACKKSKNTSTVSPQSKTDFAGLWMLMEHIQDVNNNGKIDLGDDRQFRTDTVFVTLDSNGTSGLTNGMGTVYWSLMNNNTYFQLMYENGTNITFDYEYIDSVSSSRMVLRDSVNGLANWDVYTKQIPPTLSPAATNMLGTWTKTRLIVDTNHNGISDAGDYHVDTIPKCEYGVCDYVDYEAITFNFYGRGQIERVNPTWTPGHLSLQQYFYEDITWSLANNDTDLYINGSFYAHIESINSSDMEIRADCAGCFYYNSSIEWSFFSK